MRIEKNTIYNMDCLEGMKHIPDGSIDMVLCDPPYGTVKGLNMESWEDHKCQWDVVIDHKQMLDQYDRILRTGGCLILFGQEPFTSNIIVNAHKNLPLSYRMVWVKNHYANHLSCKKAPVNYYEDIVVFHREYDTLNQHPLREYAKKVLDYCGVTATQINTALGHKKTDHFMRYKSIQFALCSEKTYEQFTEKFNLTQMDGYKSYQELKDINNKFLRVFNLYGQKIKSNVLYFKKESKSLHPTQKPVALFEDLIKTYTNEGDLVLDNCMGSGTTAIACMNTKRNYIGFEKDQAFFDIANDRIKNHVQIPLGI